jgi:hypothetical protein
LYVEVIEAAQKAGYAVLVIDSLSHAWMGKEGALEKVDAAAARSRGNSYVAWREVTPMHNRLVDAMIQSRLHLIATMRSKMAYEQERDEKTGKVEVKKLGLQPIQREGMEYEFDVFADIDLEHRLIVGKTRCAALDKYVEAKAGEKVAEILYGWATSGATQKPPPAEQAIPAKAVERLIGLMRDAKIADEDEADFVRAVLGEEKALPHLTMAEATKVADAAKALIGPRTAQSVDQVLAAGATDTRGTMAPPDGAQGSTAGDRGRVNPSSAGEPAAPSTPPPASEANPEREALLQKWSDALEERIAAFLKMLPDRNADEIRFDLVQQVCESFKVGTIIELSDAQLKRAPGVVGRIKLRR